jgi:hypothetical protein
MWGWLPRWREVSRHGLAASRPLSQRVADPEHGSVRCQLFAFLWRCIPRQLQMWAAAGRHPRVSADDRSPAVDSNLIQPDLLPLAATKHRCTAVSPNVLDPVGPLTQHRHQVLASLPVSHHNRERDSPVATTAADLQACRSSRQEARPEEHARKPILRPRQPVGPPRPVHPTVVPVEDRADRTHTRHPEPRPALATGPFVTRTGARERSPVVSVIRGEYRVARAGDRLGVAKAAAARELMADGIH